MPHLILDTDFLSSFLQIGQCELIREFYQVDHAWLPMAVYGELARTDLLSRLIAIPWLCVPPVEPAPYEVLLQNSTFQNLGAEERACITLAYAQADTVLLMSDNKARRFAQSLDIITINIPAFLLVSRSSISDGKKITIFDVCLITSGLQRQHKRVRVQKKEFLLVEWGIIFNF